MKFMSKFLGAQHDQEDFEQRVTENAGVHRKEHAAAVGRSQRHRQMRSKPCPSVDAVYGVSGGSQNKEFAKALVSERAKKFEDAHSAKQDLDDELMGECREKEVSSSNGRFPNAVLKQKALPFWLPK